MQPIVELTFKGKKFFVHKNDSWDYQGEQISRESFLNMQEGDIFLDIGAYVGSWTIPAAVQGACVFAIEPSELVINELKSNIEQNSLQNKVTVLPYLLSDWYYNDLPYNNWEIMRHGEKGDSKAVPLDDVYPSQDPIKLIKIDVEGHELRVLRGGVTTLRKAKNILIEVHRHLKVDYVDVVRFMEQVDHKFHHKVIPQDGGHYYHVYFSKEDK